LHVPLAIVRILLDKLKGGAGSAGLAANLSDYGEGRVNDVSKPLAVAVSIA
jgi:hypothetical protein